MEKTKAQTREDTYGLLGTCFDCQSSRLYSDFSFKHLLCIVGSKKGKKVKPNGTCALFYSKSWPKKATNPLGLHRIENQP